MSSPLLFLASFCQDYRRFLIPRPNLHAKHWFSPKKEKRRKKSYNPYLNFLFSVAVAIHDFFLRKKYFERFFSHERNPSFKSLVERFFSSLFRNFVCGKPKSTMQQRKGGRGSVPRSRFIASPTPPNFGKKDSDGEFKLNEFRSFSCLCLPPPFFFPAESSL